MAYGPNILPTTGWTLVNASIVGGSLIFSAGGYASIVLTDIEGSNLLSDSFLLSIIASSFTSPYTPVAFVKIRIVYSDGGMFESTTPIVANKAGLLSIVLSPTVTNYTAINASSFSAIEITINSSAVLTLTTWELCCSINNKVVTDADYYGIKITATDGLVITTADGAAQATFNAEELTMSATENGIMVDQIYFNPVSHKYTFRGTVIVNGGDVDDLFGAVNSDLESLDGSTVKKDAVYNGVRIGPTYGFEAVRSDKKARAYFRSDQMAMQTGDGSGISWENKLYYDYDSETGNTELYYNGKFTAEVIQALSAIITPNLYAEKATISELTVDQLDTSDKVKKYLATDASDDNFQRIYDQYHELVTASTDGLEASKEQAVNRNNELLYWTDETHTAATTDETVYPVWTYNYTEQIKWKVFFYEYTPGLYVPAMKWGAGAPENETYDSCMMYKLEGEFWIEMTYHDGSTRDIHFNSDGIFIDGMRMPMIIDHTPTLNDLTGYDTVLFVYDPNAPYL